MPPRKKTEPKQEEVPTIGTITFKLDKGGNVKIYVDLITVDSDAGMCGGLLQDINSGYFENALLQAIVAQSNKSPQERDFMIDVIENWRTANLVAETLKNESEVLDGPLVDPIKTFGASRL